MQVVEMADLPAQLLVAMRAVRGPHDGHYLLRERAAQAYHPDIEQG